MPPQTDPQTPSIAVFDMGGVLLDWNPRHLYRKLIPDPEKMEQFLASVTTTQWHVVQDHGGDPAEATRQLQAEFPAHTALIAAFYGRFHEMCDHAFPEMAELVDRLHRAGTPLYLLSNAPAFLDDWLRGPAHERHPFLGHFRDYVVSGKVGCAKPGPQIYDLVCRTGRFQPGDAVFVDDVLANVDGAKAFGMHAVHHRSADETARALRALGLPI